MCETVKLKRVVERCGIESKAARFILDKLALRPDSGLPKPRGQGVHLLFSAEQAATLVLYVLLNKCGIAYRLLPGVVKYLKSEWVLYASNPVKTLTIGSCRYCWISVLGVTSYSRVFDAVKGRIVQNPRMLPRNFTVTSVFVDEIREQLAEEFK